MPYLVGSQIWDKITGRAANVRAVELVDGRPLYRVGPVPVSPAYPAAPSYADESWRHADELGSVVKYQGQLPHAVEFRERAR